MPEARNQPSNSINWSKIILTVLVIVVVVGLIAGAYWYFVLNKPTSNEPAKVSTPTKQATPSATPSASNVPKSFDISDWKNLTGKAYLRAQPSNAGFVRVSIKHPKEYTTGGIEEFLAISTEPYRLPGPQEPGELSALLVGYGTEEDKNETLKDYMSKSENATLGGKEALRQVTTSEGQGQGVTHTSVAYFVKDIGKNNWGFEFRCIYFPREGVNLERICDLMASTLKFLN